MDKRYVGLLAVFAVLLVLMAVSQGVVLWYVVRGYHMDQLWLAKQEGAAMMATMMGGYENGMRIEPVEMYDLPELEAEDDEG
jgi:hypothetical protein